jgi:ribonuclease PH
VLEVRLSARNLMFSGLGTDYVLGTRERHLEAILQSTLRQIIHIHNFPRTLIQITLQITNTPENYNAWAKLVQASSVCVSPDSMQSWLIMTV